MSRFACGASARHDRQAPSNIRTRFLHKTQSFIRVDAFSSSLVPQAFAEKFYVPKTRPYAADEPIQCDFTGP